MTVNEIIHFLDSEFHPEYQEDYDNSGFLLGNPDCECTGALVALDLTPAVVDEAISLGANLIVTHHPFIFSGIKRITPANATSFLEQVKMTLGLPILRVSDIVTPAVSRVAICGGAGSFLIDDAIRQQADIYLTGDMKYHDFQRAEGRITLADIGHYESEQFGKQLIYSVISKKFSNFACFISRQGKSFVSYI